MSRIHFVWLALTGAVVTLPAAAQPLTFTNVGAPAINCVFSQPVNGHCSVTVTDSVGTIAMPPGVSGVGRLQSRTFKGAAGTPGAGLTAYEYRVDMTGAVSDGESPCVTDLAIDFGTVSKLPYQGNATKYDVYVITSGGIGSVGLYDVEETGNSIDFVFNQPVCAGPSPGSGKSSYFFGLAAPNPPHAVTAHVGWPGLLPIPVQARSPFGSIPHVVPLKPQKIKPH